MPREGVEEAALQNPPSQEPCKFPSSQDAEDALGGSQKDANTMVTLPRERLLSECWAFIAMTEPAALVVCRCLPVESTFWWSHEEGH